MAKVPIISELLNKQKKSEQHVISHIFVFNVRNTTGLFVSSVVHSLCSHYLFLLKLLLFIFFINWCYKKKLLSEQLQQNHTTGEMIFAFFFSQTYLFICIFHNCDQYSRVKKNASQQHDNDSFARHDDETKKKSHCERKSQMKLKN